MSALAMRGVVKRYRAGTRGCSMTVEVLRGIDLDVAAGERVLLTGRQGAGKSTLLLCAASLARIDGGVIAWFGHADASVPPAQVAYVPQRGTDYAFLTVHEALDYQATLLELGESERARRVARAAHDAALHSYADVRLGLLPRAVRARVAIARALLAEPRLLLLDETLDGLDREARLHVLPLLDRLSAAGVAVIASSALPESLADVDARRVELRQGVLADARAASPSLDQAVATSRRRRAAGSRTPRVAERGG